MSASIRRQRQRPWGTIIVLALIAAGLAFVALPLAQGRPIGSSFESLLALFSSEASEDEAPPIPEGYVRVPVSGRQIPAYVRVVRDDLWNLDKEQWAYTDVAEQLVEESGIVVSASDIVGRVMANDKRPAYVFTESDFLPKGTRPGLSAGIPAGKRGQRVEVERVAGIIGLQPGDRFDIVSAVPLDGAASDADLSYSGIYSKHMNLQRRLGSYKKARVTVLVQNGVVVSPLQTRAVPITASSLTSGTTSRTIPVQEMVIAMDPAEVAPFMEALAVEADMICIARSGRPDDPVDSLTPSSEPAIFPWGDMLMPGDTPGESDEVSAPMTLIERIDEGGRELVPVPSSSGGEGL